MEIKKNQLLRKKENIYFFDDSEILCGVTTRGNGYSKNDFKYWNFGLHTGENKDIILKNRKLFADKLNVKIENLVFMEQVHSDNINFVTSQNISELSGILGIKKTDAIYSNDKKLVLCVMTADCCPVLLYFKEAGVIAAIHAGWRGVVSKIVSKTIYKILEKFQLNKENKIITFIGPHICGNCYEIGKDFINNIKSDYPEYEKFLIYQDNKYFFDMSNALKTELSIFSNLDIHATKICTLENNKEFYSYRKSKNTGRFISFIKLK